jgi:hypothetical protein
VSRWACQPTEGRDFHKSFYLVVLFGILAVALAGSVVVCSWVANADGCQVDEGSVHPSVIGGKENAECLGGFLTGQL